MQIEAIEIDALQALDLFDPQDLPGEKLDRLARAGLHHPFEQTCARSSAALALARAFGGIFAQGEADQRGAVGRDALLNGAVDEFAAAAD